MGGYRGKSPISFLPPIAFLDAIVGSIVSALTIFVHQIRDRRHVTRSKFITVTQCFVFYLFGVGTRMFSYIELQINELTRIRDDDIQILRLTADC